MLNYSICCVPDGSQTLMCQDYAMFINDKRSILAEAIEWSRLFSLCLTTPHQRMKGAYSQVRHSIVTKIKIRRSYGYGQLGLYSTSIRLEPGGERGITWQNHDESCLTVQFIELQVTLSTPY